MLGITATVRSSVNDTGKLVKGGACRVGDGVQSVSNKSGSMQLGTLTRSAPAPNERPSEVYSYLLLPRPDINKMVDRAVANLKDQIDPTDPKNREELVAGCFTLIHDNCEKLVDKQKMPSDQALSFKQQLGRLAWKVGLPGEANKQGVFVPRGAGSGANPLLNPLKDLILREHAHIFKHPVLREKIFAMAEKKIIAFVSDHMNPEESKRLDCFQHERALLEKQWRNDPPQPFATVKSAELHHIRTFLQ
ncbi:hypothetical protein ACMGT0_05640 [Pseudomonas sp. RHF3.3-3]|uniref:SopE GEF domain n=1 Tax=Pseudomonas asplenii TaxID=53407 RepID=A0A0N1J5N7_9PSED|nr:hypothetical protein [Pseudomonas fuscovaginae]KPA88344.1 SopE GEF domain [Pseudomonas fuscovaginae]